MIICHKISLNLISFSSKIAKFVINLVNLLKITGTYSSKLNLEWVLISLTTMNRKECEDFWIILSKIMRKTMYWSTKKITSGNWQMSLQKKKLSEWISSKPKAKRLNIVLISECLRWLLFLIKISNWIDIFISCRRCSRN